MSKGIGRALRDLGDAVDAIEAAGASITGVKTVEDGAVGLGLRVAVPLVPEGTLEGVELAVEGGAIDDDGSLVVDLTATCDVGGTSSGADGDGGSARTEGDGGRSESDGDDVADDADPPPEAGGSDGVQTDDDPVPAYRDPDRLRAVYDDHDTFPEMTEALGVDVTPQTVRRHMIDHGIHEPGRPAARDGPGESDGGSAGGTAPPDDEGEGGAPAGERSTADATADEPRDRPSGDGPSGAEGSNAVGTGAGEREGRGASPGGSGREASEVTAVPDLVGVDDVTTEELTEAVRTSRTIREVGRRLGVPRERAFRLLNDLDLVDLVSGRLETADRRVSAEELEQRIERATAE